MAQLSVGTPAPERFGKYLILERIGMGGMSEVFLARSEGIEGFERKVALKRIFPDLTVNEEFVRSFVHEARIGGMLSHHHVVQTLDFGKVNGTYYIALEYVEGTHLGQVLNRLRERQQVMPAPYFLQLALQICEGVEYIHGATIEGEEIGLVHRDIKPSNMLISAQGLVKLSDFGVAKAESRLDGKTRVGAVKGTIGYMAPEQARGLPIGQAADLYALGCMLYEMASLRRVFGVGDELTILKRVRDCEFVEPIEAANICIHGLDTIIRRCLAPLPADRYPDASAIADALKALPARTADRKQLVTWMKALGVIEPSARESGIRRALPAQAAQQGLIRMNLAGDAPSQAVSAAPPPPAPGGLIRLSLNPDAAGGGPAAGPAGLETVPLPVRSGGSPRSDARLAAQTMGGMLGPGFTGLAGLGGRQGPDGLGAPTAHGGQGSGMPSGPTLPGVKPGAGPGPSHMRTQVGAPGPTGGGTASPLLAPVGPGTPINPAYKTTFGTGILKGVADRRASHVRQALIGFGTALLGLGAAGIAFYVVDATLSPSQGDAPLPSGPLEPPNLAPVAPAPMWVTLTLEPADAEVLLDGVLVPSSRPFRVPVKAGQRLEVRRAGYATWSAIIPADQPLDGMTWPVTLQIAGN